MLLADGGITFVLVGGLFLVGAAIVWVFRMMARCAIFVLRLCFGQGFGRREPERPMVIGRDRVCPLPRCGHVNRGDARHCARCGTALGTADES